MTRTTANLAAFVFAVVLTGLTFQQALTMPAQSRSAPIGAIVA